MATNNATNSPFPLSAAQGGTGVASPTIHGILIAQGAGAMNNIVLTAGQVLVGTTASDPVGATITGAGGITVNASSGAISITGSGVGFTWNDQTTASVTMAVNNGYVCDDGASMVTLTTPATAALGAVFAIVGKGTGLFTIAVASGQSIRFGNQTTTTTTGTLVSTNQSDVIYLVTTTANTVFTVTSAIGNLTYT